MSNHLDFILTCLSISLQFVKNSCFGKGHVSQELMKAGDYINHLVGMIAFLWLSPFIIKQILFTPSKDTEQYPEKLLSQWLEYFRRNTDQLMQHPQKQNHV